MFELYNKDVFLYFREIDEIVVDSGVSYTVASDRFCHDISSLFCT